MVRFRVRVRVKDRVRVVMVFRVRWKEGRKEGNVLFNNTFNIFYLQLYGVGHMVKDHSDSERKPAATT